MLPASQSHPSCVPCGYCPSPIYFAEQWLCLPRSGVLCASTALSHSAQTCLCNLRNKPPVSYPSLSVNSWVAALRYGRGQSTTWDFRFFSVSRSTMWVPCKSEGAPLPLGLTWSSPSMKELCSVRPVRLAPEQHLWSPQPCCYTAVGTAEAVGVMTRSCPSWPCHAAQLLPKGLWYWAVFPANVMGTAHAHTYSSSSSKGA